jgi:hypothetical protein
MISAHDDSERINIAKVRVLRSIDSHSEHVRMLGPLDGIPNSISGFALGSHSHQGGPGGRRGARNAIGCNAEKGVNAAATAPAVWQS